MSGKSSERSIDRLSSLPDEVICHILSFLPTKLSVSTCVLSKRWRFLWAHVPVWDFEGRFDGVECFEDETPNPDVIYRVILWHKAITMRTLRLHVIDCNEYQLETWISTAIGRKIQNLYLEFVHTNIVMLHRSLFNCKTVVDMSLGYCKGFSSTGDICLPSLKKLHLYHVVYEDDEALSHLLSGCPLLQELILDCPDEETNTKFLNVSSSTIKMLEVNLGDDVSFCTNTPALRCLRMVDCDWDFTRIPKDMPSLVEVYIRFNHCHYFHIDNNDSSNVLKGFHRLRNIMCLKISSCQYLKGIGGIVGPIIKFNNLTKLELRLGVEWHLLVEFLEVADNLQVLIVARVCQCNAFYRNLKYWDSCMEPKQVPKCLLSSLRTVTIKQPSEADCFTARRPGTVAARDCSRRGVGVATWFQCTMEKRAWSRSCSVAHSRVRRRRVAEDASLLGEVKCRGTRMHAMA
ncbi:Putative FBD-associated F-box protein [Striga hermonthica]|uniref:FBD-associated F-box protein n=1 Tax=Striga hermonthica TaxID=68872 RepID=A0A9N7N397_STRHE|nr:Putative FBD-associated F-box protein [Striga hermonthica]